MTKEISLPEFYVSAKFEDGQLKPDRILLKQRGEYVPYVRERTCHLSHTRKHGALEVCCSSCGEPDDAWMFSDDLNYCPLCGARHVREEDE